MDESIIPSLVPSFALGYFLGSIPFGLILTRLAGIRDIRAIGSGNIGATNVLRAAGKSLAAATLLADIVKGTVAALLFLAFGLRELALAAGLGAVIGHMFPVWLAFRGGKGVATYLGVLMALSWPVAAAFGAIWIAVAALTRYSSLAGLIASAATPFLLLWRGDRPESMLFAVLTVLLWFRHRDNLRRLAQGTESKIGGSARRDG
jgi:glycerol-3-phosphate acyltransferase PlsY